MPCNTLICTVGTSLYSNLNKLEATDSLRKAYDKRDQREIVALLLKKEPSENICGAEINTIEQVRKKNWLDLQNLHFLVSDTEDGRNIGRILTDYHKERKDLDLNVEFHVVDKLQDKDTKAFKLEGLRNLVRKAGDIIQRIGGTQFAAFDATGGYKAQIAIAVVMGQTLNMKVFYKHEKFHEIIDFPPLPICFDYNILGENADLLALFERGQTLTEGELGTIDEKLKVLLEEIEVEGRHLYALGAIGQIYLTGFRLRNPKMTRLIPSTNREEPTFPGNHHYPIGIEKYAEKVWNETPWIDTIIGIEYDKQRSIKGKGFRVVPRKEEKILIGTFMDSNNFGGRFRIFPTDISDQALNWAADDLNQKFGE